MDGHVPPASGESSAGTGTSWLEKTLALEISHATTPLPGALPGGGPARDGAFRLPAARGRAWASAWSGNSFHAFSLFEHGSMRRLTNRKRFESRVSLRLDHQPVPMR